MGGWAGGGGGDHKTMMKNVEQFDKFVSMKPTMPSPVVKREPTQPERSRGRGRHVSLSLATGVGKEKPPETIKIHSVRFVLLVFFLSILIGPDRYARCAE